MLLFACIYPHRQLWGRQTSKLDRCFQEGAYRVHERAASGAGEGVPLQPLPVPRAAPGDGRFAASPRETNQDMVSKQEDEAKKGWQIPRHWRPSVPGQPFHSVHFRLCPSGQWIRDRIPPTEDTTTAAAKPSAHFVHRDPKLVQNTVISAAWIFDCGL